MKFRITKYNPQFRLENGAYSVDDWTSITDIGKEFNGSKLNLDTYISVENKYLDAIQVILDNFNCKNIVLRKIEKYFTFEEVEKLVIDLPSLQVKNLFGEAKNEMILSVDEALLFCVLNLREALWCELVDIDKKFRIVFGYDYYMYCICNYLRRNSIKKVEDLGLYVEVI